MWGRNGTGIGLVEDWWGCGIEKIPVIPKIELSRNSELKADRICCHYWKSLYFEGLRNIFSYSGLLRVFPEC